MSARLLSVFTIAIATGLLAACGGGANNAITSGAPSQVRQPASVGQTAITPSTPVTTNWVVGGPNPPRDHDIAQAANGDRVQMKGTGTFSGGTITGGGTYIVENAAGDIQGHGTFTATAFVSFVSFGFVSPIDEGGRLITGVHMVSASGDTADATLYVDCELGSPPPGITEGILLNVTGGTNYDTSIHGRTLFFI